MNSLNFPPSPRAFIYYEADIGVLLDMGKAGWGKKTSLHSIFMPSYAVDFSVLEQVSPSILHISTHQAKEKALSTCSGVREKSFQAHLGLVATWKG